VAENRRSELRRDRFGFVFQSGQLVPELTAEENVALPLLLGGTRRKPALAGARPWFGRLGLDGLERRRALLRNRFAENGLVHRQDVA
jgi:putative ABC transport system ATP-binding protein